jgi:hypothetical protein
MKSTHKDADLTIRIGGEHLPVSIVADHQRCIVDLAIGDANSLHRAERARPGTERSVWRAIMLISLAAADEAQRHRAAYYDVRPVIGSMSRIRIELSTPAEVELAERCLRAAARAVLGGAAFSWEAR